MAADACRSITFIDIKLHDTGAGADWILKPAVAKILKRPFLPFLSSFFFVSNQPWAALNQVAYVAIAKTPRRPVRLCTEGLQPQAYSWLGVNMEWDQNEIKMTY